MCTALTFSAKHHYFGRSLDLDHRYNENIVITPRNYIQCYKRIERIERHFAIIGMATVVDGEPLYYDAVNEYGLSMAGLNFVGNASYNDFEQNKINIAPYELIPYFLGQNKGVDEFVDNIRNINICDVPYNDRLKNSQLHWIIADKSRAITLEIINGEILIYENDFGILTNNPPFEYHIMNINNYLNISAREHEQIFAENIKLDKYSKGLSGIGLPGDNSSMSRFVRCAFTKLNATVPYDEIDGVTQFFHILGSVNQVDGTVVSKGKRDRTQYMSCCDMDTGVYYYKTYNNSLINSVSLFKENLEGYKLISYDFIDKQQINNQN